MVIGVYNLRVMRTKQSISKQEVKDVLDGLIRQHYKMQLQTNIITIFTIIESGNQKYDRSGPIKTFFIITSVPIGM